MDGRSGGGKRTITCASSEMKVKRRAEGGVRDKQTIDLLSRHVRHRDDLLQDRRDPFHCPAQGWFCP